MNTAYQVFQGALGGIVAFFFALLLMDSGLSAMKEIILLVGIGAAIYGVLWFLHKRVVGAENPTQDKPFSSLSLKTGIGFFFFASIVAVGVYE